MDSNTEVSVCKSQTALKAQRYLFLILDLYYVIQVERGMQYLQATWELPHWKKRHLNTASHCKLCSIKTG